MMTGIGVSGMTTDAPNAPAATSPDAPAQAAAPDGGIVQGASHAAMLTKSEFTRRIVAIGSMAVVGLSILAIVITMCHRVWIDGNAPLTSTITTQLLWIALGGIGSMTVALFGTNAILAKLIEKVAA